MTDLPNVPDHPTPMPPDKVLEWLRYEHSELEARAAVVLQSLQATVAAYPEITSPEEDAILTQNFALFQPVRKLIEAAHNEAKAPFLSGGRVVDAWKTNLLEPMAKACATLTAVGGAYKRKVAAEAAAAAAAEAEKRRQAAEEQARLALAAKTEGEREARFDAADAEAAVAEKAQQAASARPGQHAQARGVYGASSTLRRTWKWRVVDETAIPRQYLMINADLIKDAARQRDPTTNRPTAVIPGIEWYPDDQMVVRS